MSGWTPWRSAPAMPPPPDRRDVLDRLAAEQRANNGLRRRVLELEQQVRAGMALVAAAQRECVESCPHTRVAAGLHVQLTAMQKRLDEMQQATEAADSRGFAQIPEQHGRCL